MSHVQTGNEHELRTPINNLMGKAQVSHPSALALFEPVALEVEVAKVAEMCSLHERPRRLQASSHSDPGCTRNFQGYIHRPDKMETPFLWREKALSTSFTYIFSRQYFRHSDYGLTDLLFHRSGRKRLSTHLLPWATLESSLQR